MPAKTGVTTHDRFEVKVSGLGRQGCWNWHGCLFRSGYGQFHWNGSLGRAHRYSYEHYVGPIPDGLVIDHLCRNKRCVNPAHLEVVTRQENTQRGIGGEFHFNAKLSEEIVRAARLRNSLGESALSLASEYGVAKSTMMSALKGQTWSHVS